MMKDQGRQRLRRRRWTRCRSTRSSRTVCALLTIADYQNTKLAGRYRALVTQVRDAATSGGYGEALPRAVAINYAKLLAYKDEYEVARLYTDGRFEKQLRDQFDGDFKISFNLMTPFLLRSVDAPFRPGKRLRFVADDGIHHPWQNCAACAARRSTSSARAPTASSSAT